MLPVLHRRIYERLYLRLGKVAPIHAFGGVDIPGKGVERQSSVVPRYRDDVFQHNHVAPHGIGTAFLLRAQKILEVVDEREVQLLEGNILTLVGMGQELPDMLAYGQITGECPLCPAVPHLLGELCVVLLEQLQQGFLFDTDTEIGVFELGGGNIPVRLHKLLIAAVHVHTDFIDGTVDSLRLGALSRGTAVFHVPQAWGNVQLAAELFNLAVHRDTAHQRQVAVGLGTAFLHVKQYFECTSHNSHFFWLQN